MSARWLITGAQGFVGRHVTAYILRSDPEAVVVGLGRSQHLPGFFSHCISTAAGPQLAPLPTNLLECIDDRFRYIQADVQNAAELSSVFKRERPRFVLHLASALRGDDRSALAANTMHATIALMHTALEVLPDAPVVVLGSSGGVYGFHPQHRFPLDESEPCCPQDEYSTAKLAAEHAAEAIAAGTGMRLVITRIFNIIGPGQDERHLAGNLAPRLARLSEKGCRELPLGRVDATRDYIDVSDVAAAIVELARDRSAGGVFNIANGREVSIRQFCESFLRISGLQLRLVSDGAADPGVLRSCGSIQRLQKHGITPAVTLDQSIREVLEYYGLLGPE